MLGLLMALCMALAGTILNGIFGELEDGSHAHGAEEESIFSEPELSQLDAGADALPAGAASELVMPTLDGPEPYFPEFQPGTDQLVVLYPDDEPEPDFDDLTLTYDSEYDETEVRVTSESGTRLVCYLPGVCPEDIGPNAVSFLPASDAQGMI
ncbi:hypothetical protein [Litorisediminicola beolgyonensis]|uniref:Uncharacterized protein n=1 Tax=Litorisediminicola beolgyonensis TaxID=1173614 RepID=A0ABW3ZL36_9RHOB